MITQFITNKTWSNYATSMSSVYLFWIRIYIVDSTFTEAIMKRFHGGDKAPRGYYFYSKKLDFVNIVEDYGILPGSPDSTYWPVKTIRMLIIIAVISACYIMFLPFAGIAMVMGAIVFAVVVFFIQKVLCRTMMMLCRAESWLCGILCQKCGLGCNEDFRMVWLAFILSLIFLAGWMTGILSR
ncbi:MAG: hypothetical protein UT53_C0007G0008 [Candidatus Yanofskybacteria bacterium GW2011_GWD2_39_48]|uniref:Uncharacterized protein n=1 Tax=Candidatus Yanofskybacteria bacterium GW2011_GWD2_39_48 TaxID=1619031 RepID=A0A0G0RMN7_9BACT|nr:MAG: hypothetical protein UT53_C0007G0008 [Candidatus Yanofskybacteria bacterium GW2011_GWD2_39_48]